jgi:alkylation response protein AidB-like acyl-CoA dehydrogenase
MGQKIICLNITEPNAGSDVANIKTTAVREGDHYVVNGNKKWITNGIFADYFTVAVRTGGKGMRGISMLLLERDSMPGIETKRMDCQGVWPSGTTYVEFDNVKVPAGNLIGEENQGFGVIMKNFNHERWGFVIQANRFSRCLLEESWNYASKRSTFGKKLHEHPVIRWKLAEMARQVEGTHHWLENLTLQMCRMPKEQAMTALGGPIALAKAHSSKVFEYCAREARQVFGGNAYTRSGLGEKVERLYRDVGAYAIPGGSEEILLDLSVRQALKAKL